ncbi:MAG: hypothetical protein MJZ16_11905 [Bacteroidales bacterium]|nr:hypothetical protein [Bacteroidales bacterium]
MYHRSDILAWGKRKDSEDVTCQKVRSALSSMNICAEKTRKTLPEEFLNGIPGNEMNFSKDDYLLSEASAVLCLLGWESFDKGLPEGNLQVSERLSSRPIILDLCKEAYSKGWINAYNSFVLGPTGSGKSFFMNHYLRCCHDKGAKICVLDNGRSYAGLAALIKDENGLAPAKRKSKTVEEFEFNPFAGFLEQGKWLIGEDHLDLDNPSVQFVIGIIKTICDFEDGWTAAQSSVLSVYLTIFCMMYKRETDPVFDDFYTFLVESKFDENGSDNGVEPIDQQLMKELIISLHTYSIDGSHPKTLNSPSEASLLSDDFSLFEVGELLDSSDKTYCKLCIFCIIHSFDLMMRRNVDSFKVLVIEEAWKAISNKDMEPYLNSLWKTSRKYNTAAIVVTQQMSDIISSDIIKDTIIANSPVKIVLDQRECISELDAVADTLGLTETDKRFIRSLNTQSRDDASKDVFLKIGQGKSGAYKIDVSQAEAFLYESVLKDKSELSDTINSGRSVLSLLKRKRKI